MLGFELPFIAHWEGYHYIVVYGVSKRHVWVADPARGFSKMSAADFEKGWTGTCLLFTPSADLTQAARPVEVTVGAFRRLPGAVPQHRRSHPARDAGDRAARRRCRRSSCRTCSTGSWCTTTCSLLQRAHRRADHHPPVHTPDDADARLAGELHAAQPRLRDDLAVLPAHAVAAAGCSSTADAPATSLRASRKT